MLQVATIIIWWICMLQISYFQNTSTFGGGGGGRQMYKSIGKKSTFVNFFKKKLYANFITFWLSFNVRQFFTPMCIQIDYMFH